MDGRTHLEHKDSGNNTFQNLVLDPNSNFEEFVPVDEFLVNGYMNELAGMSVDPQQQQQLGSGGPQAGQGLQPRGLLHQTSLQRHQTQLMQQQQHQQQAALQAAQAAQVDQLKANSAELSGLQHDNYGSSGLLGSILGSSGGSGQLGYAGGSGDFGARPLQGYSSGMATSAPPAIDHNYAEQQQRAISSMLQQYNQQQGGFGLGGSAGLDFGGGGGGHQALATGSATFGDVSQGYQGDQWARSQQMGAPQVPSSFANDQLGVPQLVMSGQPQPPQQQAPQLAPPNLVLSGAPLQPEFGGGAPGGPGRMSNQRIVLAGGGAGATEPNAQQFAGANGQYASPQPRAATSMPPPAHRALAAGSATFDRLAGEGARGPVSPAAGGPQAAVSGGSEELNEQQFQEGDEEMELGEDGQPTKNRRHRTLRQQMLNKQAQQRYRERKKQKASELEHTVAALSSQLETMQCVRAENADLQDKNLALVSQLKAREEELERLVREQKAQPEYVKTNSGKVFEVPKADDGPATAEEAAQLAETYQATVRELREILAKHGLENREGADIAGTAAPEAQLQRLGELVETVNNIHSRALRMEGATAAGLVSASVERSSGRHDGNRRWLEAAKSMHFTPEQASKLLDVRREHLKRLQRIYEERRQVNLEAISVLLPQERGGSAPSMSVERHKSWLPSMFHRSKHASRQKDVMKKLKDNLSEEQRLASELDYLVFRRILTPVQGAWFVLAKYPAYCDSLSLCNGVAEMHGQVELDI